MDFPQQANWKAKFVDLDKNLNKDESFYAIKSAHQGCKDSHTQDDRKSRMLPLTGLNNLHFGLQGLFLVLCTSNTAITHRDGDHSEMPYFLLFPSNGWRLFSHIEGVVSDSAITIAPSFAERAIWSDQSLHSMCAIQHGTFEGNTILMKHWRTWVSSRLLLKSPGALQQGKQVEKKIPMTNAKCRKNLDSHNLPRELCKGLPKLSFFLW